MVDGKMLENDEALLNLSALNYVVKKFLISLIHAYHVVLFLLLQLQLSDYNHIH
jgi:hypothetical protein